MFRRLLIVLLFALCLASGAWAQERTPEPTPPAAADPLSVADTQAIVNDARELHADTVELVNLMLTAIGLLIAGLTFIGALALGGLSIFGLRSIRDVRRQVDEVKQQREKLEALQAQVTTARQKLESDQERLDQQLAHLQSLPDNVTAALEMQERKIEDEINKQQAESAEQNEALALVQFAVRQIDVGNVNAAKHTLQRAIGLSEDNRVANFLLGEVLVRTGRYVEGRDYLLKAQPDDDAMPDARASLAYCYRMLGDADTGERDYFYTEAEGIYEALRIQHPDLLDITGDSVYGALGGLYRNTGRIDKALEIYAFIAERTPEASYPFNNLGLLHCQYAGQYGASREKGLDYFRESLRKSYYRLQNESATYWQLFDRATAQVALQEVDWPEMALLLDEILDQRPPRSNLLKLENGLRQLMHVMPPPQLAAPSLDYLAQRRYLLD